MKKGTVEAETVTNLDDIEPKQELIVNDQAEFDIKNVIFQRDNL